MRRCAQLGAALLLCGFAAACATHRPATGASGGAEGITSGGAADVQATAGADLGGEARAITGACGGRPLAVRFYDAGQALAALVTFPDGRRLLVDTGEDPKRVGCGRACEAWHRSMMQGLKEDLRSEAIELLWITHQHSDHVGGAAAVLEEFTVHAYVDNGRDLSKPAVKRVRDEAARRGVAVHVVDPDHPGVPFEATDEYAVRAVLPEQWPRSCERNANNCSIGLRIDYCESSILFVGDAEQELEAAFNHHGPVTLLQVAHHGSDTSSTSSFLASTSPSYAVISAAVSYEGTNRTYCHPRASTVERLTTTLGGPGSETVRAFGAAVKCKASSSSDWSDTPASDRLWATGRDGDVLLVTTGDGRFELAPEGG